MKEKWWIKYCWAFVGATLPYLFGAHLAPRYPSLTLFVVVIWCYTAGLIRGEEDK